jgi:hypothetical protein
MATEFGMKEIIQDTLFETLGTPDAQWVLKTHQGVEITPTTDDGMLSLAITGTSGTNAHAELLYQPFAVKKGDIFEITFSAKAKKPFAFSVWIGQANDPYQSLVDDEDHFGEQMMTDDWECYSHTFTATMDEPNARLDFVLGAIDNVVELEDVSLLHIDQVAQ